MIADFASFENAKPLPKEGDAHAASAAVAAVLSSGSGPSFDCAKASAPVEKLISGEWGRAGLDRTLADAYALAMGQWPDDVRVRERAAQRTWIADRNGCARTRDPKACVESSYRHRLAEVQIRGGQLEAPMAVG